MYNLELRRDFCELEAALQRCKNENRKFQATIDNQISEHVRFNLYSYYV